MAFYGQSVPLSSKWGREGTITFHFPIFLDGWTLRFSCVCWLEEARLLVHCRVLQISCIEGTALYPV